MAVKVKAISIPKGYGLPKGKGKKYEKSAKDMKEDAKGMNPFAKKKKK